MLLPEQVGWPRAEPQAAHLWRQRFVG
ncbi:uncharacterized protein METZ01_LOCUS350745, partial [marine metagenome]